jgi:hypothetical protein
MGLGRVQKEVMEEGGGLLRGRAQRADTLHPRQERPQGAISFSHPPTASSPPLKIHHPVASLCRSARLSLSRSLALHLLLLSGPEEKEGGPCLPSLNLPRVVWRALPAWRRY